MAVFLQSLRSCRRRIFATTLINSADVRFRVIIDRKPIPAEYRDTEDVQNGKHGTMALLWTGPVAEKKPNNINYPFRIPASIN